MIWFVLIVVVILLIVYILVEYVTILEIRDLKKRIEENDRKSQRWTSLFITDLAKNNTDIESLKKDHDQVQKNSDSIMATLKEIVRINNQLTMNKKLLDQIWSERKNKSNDKKD